MSKRLLVVNPGQCMEVLFDQQITIGRDIFNSLCVQDPEVSRSHAIIFEQDGEMTIKDLRSRNGIYVRGEHVAESLLNTGDEIILGSTVIIFDPSDTLDIQLSLSSRGRHLLDRRSAQAPKPTDLPQSTFSCEEMDQEIAELLSAESEGATFMALPHMLGLLRLVSELDRQNNTRDMFTCALTRAREMLGGHRGVVMECDDARERLKVRALFSGEGAETVNIGQQVLKVVLKKERCIYCPNVLRDARFDKISSNSKSAIYSFLAVPILGREELFGFMYLDSEDMTASYDFAALRTLYFIASHVGALLRARPIRFPHGEEAARVDS